MSDEIPPTPEAAIALVREFLHHAADLGDAATARTLMTEDSHDIPAFDPRGLAGMQYLVGEPIAEEEAVIVPVGLADAAGQQATVPLVVVLENGLPRIDVGASVELMMGGEVHFVEGDEEGGDQG